MNLSHGLLLSFILALSMTTAASAVINSDVIAYTNSHRAALQIEARLITEAKNLESQIVRDREMLEITKQGHAKTAVSEIDYREAIAQLDRSLASLEETRLKAKEARLESELLSLRAKFAEEEKEDLALLAKYYVDHWAMRIQILSWTKKRAATELALYEFRTYMAVELAKQQSESRSKVIEEQNYLAKSQEFVRFTDTQAKQAQEFYRAAVKQWEGLGGKK